MSTNTRSHPTNSESTYTELVNGTSALFPSTLIKSINIKIIRIHCHDISIP